MSLTKDVEVLSTIPLFAKVNPAKLKVLAFASERLECLSGNKLFRQDDYYLLAEHAAGGVNVGHGQLGAALQLLAYPGNLARHRAGHSDQNVRPRGRPEHGGKDDNGYGG